MKSQLSAWIISLIALMSITLHSCYKEPRPGIGRVIVINQNKNRVPNATVKLSNGNINETLMTDVNGTCTYENKLEVILNVEARRGTQVGTGILRVKPGQTNTSVITIY